jgi:hypothetical protein
MDSGSKEAKFLMGMVVVLDTILYLYLLAVMFFLL